MTEQKVSYYKVTTQGDDEGRTTNIIGYFKGTPNQIATWLQQNNIKPYHYFNFDDVKENPVQDVTQLQEQAQVVFERHGRVKILTSKELEKEIKKNNALAKLTDEEKEVLGLS